MHLFIAYHTKPRGIEAKIDNIIKFLIAIIQVWKVKASLIIIMTFLKNVLLYQKFCN